MDYQILYDDSSFVPLPHPGESRAMEKLGYTNGRAFREGRVFYDEYCVCLECRAIVRRRRPHLPSWDAYGSVFGSRRRQVVSTAILAAVAVLASMRGWPTYVVLAAILAALVVAELVWARRAKRVAAAAAARYAAEARAAGQGWEEDRCDRCGRDHLEDYLAYVIRHEEPPAFRCPRCDELELRHDPTYMAVA